MRKGLIVLALNLKINKLLEKYGDHYFDQMTGNSSLQIYGYTSGTSQLMKKLEEEIDILDKEIAKIGKESWQEFAVKDAEEFKSIVEQVSALSEKVDSNE